MYNSKDLNNSQNDAETENIDVLTDQKIKGGKHCNYVIERNWEFIENLKCPRLNFGMNQKPATEAPPTPAADEHKSPREPPNKKAKHIRFD